MTRIFVQNRIEELKRICASLEGESVDPDSKGLPLANEVPLAVTQIRRGIKVLEDSLAALMEEELARYDREMGSNFRGS